MAFRLNPGEPVPAELKRAVTEQLQAAADLLAKPQTGEERDKAVHEARKSIKKTRSVLRLVRGELAPLYATENRRLRDAGRNLSALRDSAVMLETFDSLEVESPSRETLVRHKRESEEADTARVLRGAAAALRSAARRVNAWPLETEGFGAIAQGLEKTYRQGRRAMAAAEADPRPGTFHEWRKRTKDHWYHVRLLEDLWPEVMKAHAASLKELETWLGDDHNLAVLEEKTPDDAALHEAIAERQRDLRSKAVALGHIAYAGKPKSFVSRLRRLWEAATGAASTGKRYSRAT